MHGPQNPSVFYMCIYCFFRVCHFLVREFQDQDVQDETQWSWGVGHASATVPRICQSSASRQQAVSSQCLGPGPAELTFCPPGSPFSTCSQEVAQHLVSWDCLVHSPWDFQSRVQVICFCIPGLLKNGSPLPEWIPLDWSGCMALSCQLLL